jgi:hypothetical protein
MVSHLSDSREHSACSDRLFSRGVLNSTSAVNIVVAGTVKTRGICTALWVVQRTPLVDGALLDGLVHLHFTVRSDIVFISAVGIVFVSLVGV